MPGKNAMVSAGKALWNLGVKGLVRTLHNFVSPTTTIEHRVDRLAYYETLFDNLDPSNTDESLFTNLSKIKQGVDEVKHTIDPSSKKLSQAAKQEIGGANSALTFGNSNIMLPSVFSELGGGVHAESHPLGTGIFAPPNSPAVTKPMTMDWSSIHKAQSSPISVLK